ncbi:MAG: long-chain fatty acid--CoA ligase [Candidatus Marinimicrobia bacterium]|nr:long-chain fatty acid--CoA ligase [Candidatus Neomarinimicrobiota bacterium]
MTYQLKYIETIPELFSEAVEKNAERVAFYAKKEGKWEGLTYREFRDITENVAMGMNALGIKKGDRIAIQSDNRPEWVITDYACAHFGIVSVTIYPTLVENQVEYILKDSGSTAVFAASEEDVKKVLAVRKNLPDLKYIIVFDPFETDDPMIISFQEVIEKGKAYKETVDFTLESRGAERVKDDLWTIIYTSGTTGNPKGVMLSHFNIATNVQSSMATLQFKRGCRWLSFLPLSHSLERVGIHMSFWIGSTTYFSEGIQKVADNLKEAKPHYLVSVPRLYEKIYAKVLDEISQSSELTQKIFFWAKNIGSEVSRDYIQKGKEPTGFTALKYKVAHKLVLSKIHDVFGGHFIMGISGGAPLSPVIGEFFAAAGIVILEGFGLTETTPVTNVTPRDKIKFGKVGPTLPDVEMKIAEDGEVLFRGPNIMMGYWNDEEATREVIDEEGWLHSGDIGVIDEDGFLQITDRKKNIIVTSGGKNIAPFQIETLLSKSKYIEEVVVVGDKRNFLTAAIVPTQESVELWAKEQGIDYKSWEELQQKQEVYDLIEKEIEHLQEGLARYEKVKKFFIPPKPFTIEGGELTPSLKVKRGIVEEKYKKEIDALYQA